MSFNHDPSKSFSPLSLKLILPSRLHPKSSLFLFHASSLLSISSLLLYSKKLYFSAALISARKHLSRTAKINSRCNAPNVKSTDCDKILITKSRGRRCDARIPVNPPFVKLVKQPCRRVLYQGPGPSKHTHRPSTRRGGEPLIPAMILTRGNKIAYSWTNQEKGERRSNEGEGDIEKDDESRRLAGSSDRKNISSSTCRER